MKFITKYMLTSLITLFFIAGCQPESLTKIRENRERFPEGTVVKIKGLNKLGSVSYYDGGNIIEVTFVTDCGKVDTVKLHIEQICPLEDELGD